MCSRTPSHLTSLGPCCHMLVYESASVAPSPLLTPTQTHLQTTQHCEYHIIDCNDPTLCFHCIDKAKHSRLRTCLLHKNRKIGNKQWSRQLRKDRRSSCYCLFHSLTRQAEKSAPWLLPRARTPNRHQRNRRVSSRRWRRQRPHRRAKLNSSRLRDLCCRQPNLHSLRPHRAQTLRKQMVPRFSLSSHRPPYLLHLRPCSSWTYRAT